MLRARCPRAAATSGRQCVKTGWTLQSTGRGAKRTSDAMRAVQAISGGNKIAFQAVSIIALTTDGDSSLPFLAR
jgi:hypothetical protein